MPVKIKKLGKGRCRVSTPRGVKSKNTSCKKARAQQRLLNAIEYNPDFTPRQRQMEIHLS